MEIRTSVIFLKTKKDVLKSVSSNCLRYNYIMSIFSCVVVICSIVIKATKMANYVVLLLELYFYWPSLDWYFLQVTFSFDISFTLNSKVVKNLYCISKKSMLNTQLCSFTLFSTVCEFFRLVKDDDKWHIFS